MEREYPRSRGRRTTARVILLGLLVLALTVGGTLPLAAQEAAEPPTAGEPANAAAGATERPPQDREEREESRAPAAVGPALGREATPAEPQTPPDEPEAASSTEAPAGEGEEAGSGAAPAAEPPPVEVTIEDERPLRGQSVRITVLEGGLPLAAARVVAVYRPNSSTQHREELAAVDSSGLLLWTPTDAGPVTLEVREPGTPADADAPPVASLTVAVRYGSFPPMGLFIMVTAGILLFGGAAVAFVLLLRPVNPATVHEPPST